MVRRWEQSKAGQRQVVLISGEAGIGKSALVDTLRAHVRREGLTRIALRCSPPIPPNDVVEHVSHSSTGA